MKSRVIITVLTTALSGLLAAQGVFAQELQFGQGRDWILDPPSVELRLHRLDRLLHLTDQQSRTLAWIISAHDEERRELWSSDLAVTGNEACEMHERQRDEVLALLDAEQDEAFMKISDNWERRVFPGEQIDCSWHFASTGVLSQYMR